MAGVVNTVTASLFWDTIKSAAPKNGIGWEADIDIWMTERQRRAIFINNFSFAVPTPPSIAAIRDFVGKRNLLEIGAGSGLWAGLLSQEGVQITAVDDASGKYSLDDEIKPLEIGKYYPVDPLTGQDALKLYADHQALLLCWPGYDLPMAAECLELFHGDRVVYIGEGSGGCTGDERFHTLLDEQWHLDKTADIPQWPGIHDVVYLYRH